MVVDSLILGNDIRIALGLTDPNIADDDIHQMSCPNVLIGHPVLTVDSRQMHAGMTGALHFF